MGASNPTQKSIKFYSLKAKADETNTPAFVESVKIDGKWQRGEPFSTMSGMLSGATIKEKDFDGTKTNIFVLTFIDDKETSQVEFTHNGLTHSIINCLSGMDNYLHDISISVGKKTDDNNKVWGQAYINTNLNAEGRGEMAKWSFDPKTAPAKEPVLLQNGQPFIKDGKPVKDDTKLRAFFEEVFRSNIMSKLAAEVGAKVHNDFAQTDFTKPFANAGVAHTEVEQDDTLPF